MAMTALQRRNPAGMESWREWISRLSRRHPIAVPRRFGEWKLAHPWRLARSWARGCVRRRRARVPWQLT